MENKMNQYKQITRAQTTAETKHSAWNERKSSRRITSRPPHSLSNVLWRRRGGDEGRRSDNVYIFYIIIIHIHTITTTTMELGKCEWKKKEKAAKGKANNFLFLFFSFLFYFGDPKKISYYTNVMSWSIWYRVENYELSPGNFFFGKSLNEIEKKIFLEEFTFCLLYRHFSFFIYLFLFLKHPSLMPLSHFQSQADGVSSFSA